MDKLFRHEHTVRTLFSTILGIVLAAQGAMAQVIDDFWVSTPTPALIFDVAAAPEITNTAYVLSNQRVFQSNDQWQTWDERSPFGLEPSQLIFDITFDPRAPERLFFSVFDIQAESGHIFRSDGPNSWRELTLPGGDEPRGIYAPMTDPPTLFVPGESNTWYRSLDNGITWIPSGNLPGNGLPEFHPADPTVIWQVGSSIHRSTNSGQSWSEVYSFAPETHREFTVDPTDPSRAFLVEDTDLFRTNNGGASWSRVGTLPVSQLSDGVNMDLVAMDDRLVLSLDDLNDDVSTILVQSFDNGQTWQNIAVPGAVPTQLRWFQGSTTLVGFGHDDLMPLLVSRDRGTSWRTHGTSLDTDNVTSVVWVGDDRDVLLIHGLSLASEGSREQLGRSTNNGQSWQAIDLPALADERLDMVVDPLDPENILLPTLLGSEVLRSTDAGLTWTVHDVPRPILDMAFDPEVSDRVLAATADSVLLSTNGGVSWSVLADSVDSPFVIERGITIDPENPQRLYFYGPNSQTFRSVDGGMTWGVEPNDPAFLSELLFDRQDPNKLYAVSPERSDFYRSLDGGTTWIEFATPTFSEITAFAQDSRGLLWIAHAGPFVDSQDPFWSGDGGETWSRLDTGLPSDLEVRDFGPGPDGRLALGSERHGTYLLTANSCTPDTTTACLLEGKFRVEASQQPLDDPSTSVEGRVMQFDTARAESEQSVFFESFQDGNFEVGVKMVDACGLPEGNPQRAFWAFFGGLTNAETTIRIDDLTTGESYVWNSPAGELAQSLGDTTALPCEVENPPPPQACEPVEDIACLFDGRFRIGGSMQSFDDPPITVPARVMNFAGGRAESEQSVFFESFQAGNFELGVKMVDACGLPDDNPLRAYWVFYGGLTNAGSRVVVTQLGTGESDDWRVEAGVLPRSEGRLSAFACE